MGNADEIFSGKVFGQILKNLQRQVVQLLDVYRIAGGGKQNLSLLLLRVCETFRGVQFLDDFGHVEMVDSHFLEETHHLVVRGQWVNITIENFQQIGNDYGFQGGVQ
jgi:hypothetical protein